MPGESTEDHCKCRIGALTYRNTDYGLQFIFIEFVVL